MGRTVRSYRTVLEDMIGDWQSFRKALRKEDQEAFDRLMERARQHASAASYETRSDPLESLFMAILLEQEKELAELRKRLEALEDAK